MCIISSRVNTAYSLGICPDYLEFQKNKELDLDGEKYLKPFQEKGIIKNVNYKKFTLTLVLEKNGKKTREVKIEGVDKLQCLFLLIKLEIGMGTCQQDCACQQHCDLQCCIVRKLVGNLKGRKKK